MQKIISWSEEALEILGTALLQNRNDITYTMMTSTELLVKCKEDNWKVCMTKTGLFHLYHNNYVVVAETKHRFTDGYHDQNVESSNLQEIVNYIIEYSWGKNHTSSEAVSVKRGDIYYADLTGIEHSIGCEQTGKRPVLVIQNDVGNNHSSTTIVATLTTNIKRNMPTHVILSGFKGLQHTSAVCLEQIKTIDKSRLENYCGNIGPDKMKKIDDAIKVSVGINSSTLKNDQIMNAETKKEEIALVHKETIYENQDNDWLHIMGRQLDFYSNLEQYISNLKIEQEDLERDIEEVLLFIEENNCNAAQEGKLYIHLREHRIRRKEIIKELQLLEIWTESIECQKMVELYQHTIAKMQKLKKEQEQKGIAHNFFEEAS